MSVPPYQSFIEPVLRYLAAQQSGVSANEVHDAAADILHLNAQDRSLQLPSGGEVFRNRAGWAFDRLKRAGLAVTPSYGAWALTDEGRLFAADNLKLTGAQVTMLAGTVTKAPAHASRGSINLVNAPRSWAPPGGDRKAYRLPARPIASGGQADVYDAIRKADNKRFVLKRVRGPHAAQRLRREIEVQRSLSHPNVMPVLDWDLADFKWYVMPRGNRTMADLPRPVEPQLLFLILRSVAAALALAHAAGHPHRDVKPQNIIELPGDTAGELRWVLADWGLTRRPLGATTAALTRSGDALGTDGFAPPEAYRTAHETDAPGDIYALGQVIAWATGVDPAPNLVPQVEPPWRDLVEPMTRLDSAQRCQTIAEVLELTILVTKALRPRE